MQIQTNSSLKNRIFDNKTPEEIGVSSNDIIAFLNELSSSRVNMHGFKLIRGDSIFAEGYWGSYNADSPHRMYSVSKSFTSLAIGLLEDEGKLKLTDKICSYFPEKLPENVHPYIEKMTIRDLLTMSTAHTMTTYKRFDGDWVESFFKVEPNHWPGTVFNYDTSASHVLAALAEKLSGMEILDYMRVKFLDEIGFSKEGYFIKDPYNIPMGGSGLVCSLEDITRVIYVLANNGVYNGKEVYPPKYIKAATAKQVDTSVNTTADEQQGYGYQIWRLREDGFAFYGMGGQLAIYMPQKDMILTTIADTMDTSTGIHDIHEAFLNNIYLKCGDKALAANPMDYKELQGRLNSLSLKVQTGEVKEFTFNKRCRFNKNSSGIESLEINISGDTGNIEYMQKGKAKKVHFGINRIIEKEFSNGSPYTASASVFAPQPGHETITVAFQYLGDDFVQIKAAIAFNDDYVSVKLKKFGENETLALVEECFTSIG